VVGPRPSSGEPIYDKTRCVGHSFWTDAHAKHHLGAHRRLRPTGRARLPLDEPEGADELAEGCRLPPDPTPLEFSGEKHRSVHVTRIYQYSREISLLDCRIPDMLKTLSLQRPKSYVPDPHFWSESSTCDRELNRVNYAAATKEMQYLKAMKKKSDINWSLLAPFLLIRYMR
jgi:hypothetical protein